MTDQMTPQEFKRARGQLGLSGSQLAEILNVEERTLRRWEAGSNELGPNPIAVRVVRWMVDGFRPPEWPDSPRYAKRGRPKKIAHEGDDTP